jgi:hypothetical protein
MFRRLKMLLLLVPFLFIFAVIAVADPFPILTTPMVTFNPAGIYVTSYQLGVIDPVASSMSAVAIPEINPAQTLMVFNDDGVIKLYNLSSKSVTSISTVTALNQSNGGNVAHFTADGKILFVANDYLLKKMDTDGTNIVTVASPTTGYNFTYLALSPGRNKLVIIENAQGCANYYTCNAERLVVMNADGTSRSVIKSEYVGEWNLLSWRQDSQALLYYHHLFSGGVKGPAKYTLFDLSGGPVVTTDFSGGKWNTEENACFFTKKGNLLSMFNQELYDGRTGNLIANVSSTVPNMMVAGMMGWTTSGDYYFADNASGTNFRKFVEPGSIGHDFNNDTKPDILWRNPTTGDNWVWFMNGTNFAGSALLFNVPDPWEIVATADFNADGSPDIIWRNPTTGDNYVWFMNGTNFAGSALLFNVPDPWEIVATADFNADGSPDIIWRNPTTGDNWVWFMNGTNFAGSALLFNVPDPWEIVGTGDFNADNKPDILWRNPTTGDNYVWFMDGTNFAGSALLFNVASPWEIVGTGDFNADNKPDILWRNPTTGDNYVWFMNGTNFAGSALLFNVASPWEIVGR